MASKKKLSGVAAIEHATSLRAQLDDPEQAAENEPRPADEQQALDDMLHDPAAVAPTLRPVAERVDSKTPLRHDDERCAFAHDLDAAPRNSKIVRTDRGAVFATPDGSRLLTPFDPAQQLPRDVKIVKLGEGEFRASIPNEQGAFDYVNGATVIALIVDVLFQVHGE